MSQGYDSRDLREVEQILSQDPNYRKGDPLKLSSDEVAALEAKIFGLLQGHRYVLLSGPDNAFMSIAIDGINEFEHIAPRGITAKLFMYSITLKHPEILQSELTLEIELNPSTDVKTLRMRLIDSESGARVTSHKPFHFEDYLLKCEQLFDAVAGWPIGFFEGKDGKRGPDLDTLSGQAGT